MRTIFAEYNPKRNSIDVYTSVGYMLRIDCSPTAKDCIKCRPKCVPRFPAASRVHANSISAVSSPQPKEDASSFPSVFSGFKI